MIRKGLFASTAVCTTRDRALEQRINARLAAGHVAAYTIKDGDDTKYGLTYSNGIKSKNFERDRFELDVDALIKGLGITATDMANTQLPRGWVYDVDDADANPLEDA
jgi:hypothetical protein